MATAKKTVSSNPPTPSSKRICQNKDCDAMRRYQGSTNFFKSRNESIEYHPYCKDCVRKSIDINNMQTVYDVLQVLDVPFVKDVWDEVVQKCEKPYIDDYLFFINDIYKSRYKNARFKDSIYVSEIKDDDVDEEEKESNEEKRTEIRLWNDEWQGYYSEKELRYLNDYYSDLQNDFKIVTRNHKDYAKKIAQASLAMSDAFNIMRDNPNDKDAVAAYKSAADNFDRLSKSAQFAESQRGANDVSLGCFGRVFDAVEKHNFVPKHIPEDKDMFDKIIEQFSNIEKSL